MSETHGLRHFLIRPRVLRDVCELRDVFVDRGADGHRIKLAIDAVLVQCDRTLGAELLVSERRQVEVLRAALHRACEAMQLRSVGAETAVMPLEIGA